MIYRDYAAYLQKFFPGKKPVFAVADASDGSVGPVLKVLSGKTLKLKILNGTPDGNFPAHGPDPMRAGSQKELFRAVKKFKADFGAIFDGDGDRVFFADDLGRAVNPDAAALFISKNFKPPFVVTPESGYGFGRSLAGKDKKASPVGHYYIKRLMARSGALFGAEISGHYYFEFTFGDRNAHYDSGLRAFMEFASRVSALKENGQKLSWWLDSLPRHFSSGELNFKVKKAEAVLLRVKKFYKGKGKISEPDGVSLDGKDFWFNIRPSNTESLLRLDAEAKTKKELESLVGELKKIIKS